MVPTIFSFKIDSSREGALRQLDEQKSGPVDVKDFTPDETLLNAAKEFAKQRIAELPEEFDGVLMIVQGSSDKASGRYISEIQIYGKRGHL